MLCNSTGMHLQVCRPVADLVSPEKAVQAGGAHVQAGGAPLAWLRSLLLLWLQTL